jgi:hypothetical protein
VNQGSDELSTVQVAKKAKRETLPATSLYSERSRASDATHEVLREQEYKDAADPDVTVPPEERAKAYKVTPSLEEPALVICCRCHAALWQVTLLVAWM